MRFLCDNRLLWHGWVTETFNRVIIINYEVRSNNKTYTNSFNHFEVNKRITRQEQETLGFDFQLQD